MLTGSSPIFAAGDIPATIQFYTEVLGFTSSWMWGEPPTFGAATMGKVTIMFGFNPELVGRVEGHGHWVDVEDVNALHERHLALGAPIVSPIEDKPWGRREYTVRDLNGYHLRFAGDPNHTPKGTGVFPADVKIVQRMPTKAEFTKVAGAAFNREGTQPGVLERTWKCIVAEGPDGEGIGMVRIMYDAPGWFSIWDVAVLPEWEGQRIGSAMMDAALEVIREESPGAWVYLFTYKPEFYARLGFGSEGVQMRKV